MSFMGNDYRLYGKSQHPKRKTTPMHFTATAVPYLTLESLCGLLKLVHFVLEV